MQPPARTLLVEDEALIAMQLEDMLDSLGLGPVACAGDVASALRLAETGDFTLAFLDISIAGEPVWPVADRLADRGIPFILCTGGTNRMPERHAHAPMLAKPYGPGDLAVVLAGVGAVAPMPAAKPAIS